MKIKDFISAYNTNTLIRDVPYIMIHRDDETKSLPTSELSSTELILEFKKFRITRFIGQNCIEFTL